jgi:hypothetical protein
MPENGKVDEAGETAITKILLKDIVDERLTRCESHGNEGFERANLTPACLKRQREVGSWHVHVLAGGLRVSANG